MKTKDEMRLLDLKEFTDVELIQEIRSRGYDEHEYESALYQMDAISADKDDQIFGSSEAGLHGRNSDKKK